MIGGYLEYYTLRSAILYTWSGTVEKHFDERTALANRSDTTIMTSGYGKIRITVCLPP